MKRFVVFTYCVMLTLLLLAKDAIDYVDPLIGTASRRKDGSKSAAMQPFVGVPFGMWQWTAMTRLTELGTVSFSDADEKVIGFIGTRQPAPWMGEYGQISLLPQIGPCRCDYETRGVGYDRGRSLFTPYFCKVALGNGIIVEVTGSSRCAMFRFHFPPNEAPRIIIDASRKFIGNLSDRSQKMGAINFESDRRVRAFNEDRADAMLGPPLTNCVARFCMEMSRPFAAHGGGAEADDCHGWMEFAPSSEPLVIKISQSMIDFSKAEDNMRRECGAGFDFEAMRERSRIAWKQQLGRIEIDADETIKQIFYTGMYHALQFPREFGEYGRYYSAFDDRVHLGDSYTSYSLWDTFRAEHAFLMLAAPERVDGMVSALLHMYKEGGWLPKWPNPAYTGIMVGGPAEIMIAQAVACGFRGFDLNLAYEAVKHNATVPSLVDEYVKWTGREHWRGTPEGRGGLSTYQTLGYVAADRTVESVSRTQDFGHADHAAAVLAETVGATADAAYFRKRSANYRNLWNAERGLFLPRFADGSWKFNPQYHWRDGDYTEQSAETAVWNVPYDILGLVDLLGGRMSFERKLDEYFIHIFYGGREDGLTCHENETTHHCAYLYSAIGAHEKCAKHVRRILMRGYSSEHWGMEGNDDCGQMSAWYILSALGFYPLDPTTGEYVIGSPLVRSATVRIGAPFKPAAFTVVAHNQSRDNCIVKSVKLNGVELKGRRIRHSDIVKGGTLEFVMSDK